MVLGRRRWLMIHWLTVEGSDPVPGAGEPTAIRRLLVVATAAPTGCCIGRPATSGSSPGGKPAARGRCSTATATERAAIVGDTRSVPSGLNPATDHPERVEAAVFIGASYPGGGGCLTSARGSRGGRARHLRGLGRGTERKTDRLCYYPGLRRVLLLMRIFRLSQNPHQGDRGWRWSGRSRRPPRCW